jgi:hypothetical protein
MMYHIGCSTCEGMGIPVTNQRPKVKFKVFEDNAGAIER